MTLQKTNPTPQLLNRLRMRQVALMLAIQEHRTLRGASNSLGMTQPAASKMLHELEEALGEKLFDRVGRGMQLNPAGQAVMNTFRSLRNNMTALTHELHELRLGSAGKLFVGCILVAVPTYLCTALVALKKRYPLLSVEILVDTSDRLVELLRGGTIDVVIGRVPKTTGPDEQDCIFRPIADETISVVVAHDHPLLKLKKKLTFEAMLPYAWILQPRGSPSREGVEQEFLSRHAALPLGLIETTSFLAQLNLITRGNMIGVMPQNIAQNYEQRGMLSILPYTFTHRLTPWGSLVHRDRTVAPITQAFLDLLHADEAS